ncbi:hypothetical protein H6P81_015748 [Aristolochia fimbriata]|uniref:Uncharacterized protein n=1 Tax=Aristolochia fimbriata TaxID=158543 RepID=A0AAV7EB03_ARIFI|nr:hypothetical protein H6P81_015748 [Aristolochia fimbriata]
MGIESLGTSIWLGYILGLREMAMRFSILFLVVVLSLAMEVSCGDGGEQGGYSGGVRASTSVNYGRKILVSSEEVLRGLRRSASPVEGRNFSWELRKVPSGPDPLHHNRGPKKPQTP